MRKMIIYVLYAVSAFLNDFAFYVIGKGQEDMGISINTHWMKHKY